MNWMSCVKCGSLFKASDSGAICDNCHHSMFSLATVSLAAKLPAPSNYQLLETIILEDHFSWSFEEITKELNNVAARHAEMMNWSEYMVRPIHKTENLVTHRVFHAEVWGIKEKEESKPVTPQGFEHIELADMYAHLEDYRNSIATGMNETDALKIFWMKAHHAQTKDSVNHEKEKELLWALGSLMMREHELKHSLKQIANLRQYLTDKPSKALDAVEIAEKALGVKNV